jgi:NADH-quinone oxidoreductase subunit H
VERKVIAHVQVRMGPSRVGPHGLLQPLADVIKLITKEGVLPPHVNKFFYLPRAVLAVFMALISHLRDSVRHQHHDSIFGTRATTMMELADLNVGILVILAHQFDGRLRHRAGRLGFEQQVQLLGGCAVPRR